jgi:hypothetical protein
MFNLSWSADGLGRINAAMISQHRDAFCYTVIADITGRAGYKAPDSVGITAAERATQIPPQQPAQPPSPRFGSRAVIHDSLRQSTRLVPQPAAEPLFFIFLVELLA